MRSNCCRHPAATAATLPPPSACPPHMHPLLAAEALAANASLDGFRAAYDAADKNRDGVIEPVELDAKLAGWQPDPGCGGIVPTPPGPTPAPVSPAQTASCCVEASADLSRGCHPVGFGRLKGSLLLTVPPPVWAAPAPLLQAPSPSGASGTPAGQLLAAAAVAAAVATIALLA